MAGNITLSATFADALLNHSGTSVTDQLGGGSLVLYSGTPPTGANEALSGNTVLATFAFAAATAWSTTSTGVLTLDIPTTTVTAVASGTASFFRILNSSSAALIQGLVSTSGSDWNLSSTAVTSGDNVSITGTPTITLPVT